MNSQPLVRMRNVTKRFGSIVANDSVDLDVFPGEIHALVGENGSGKSTLMHILTGLILPDSGEITVDSSPVRFRNPAEALSYGIGMVHQKPALIEELTIAENLSIGLRGKRTGESRDHVRHLQSIFRLYDIGIDLHTRVSSLTDSMKEYIALAGLLARPVKLIILDEPSSTFSTEDERRYFSLVKRVAISHVAIVFITHKLREVSRLADRVTVMRKGKSVFSGIVKERTDTEIRSLMFGDAPPPLNNTHDATGPDVSPAAILQVENVSSSSGGIKGLRKASLSVAGGEVVAVTGIREFGPQQLEAVCTGTAAPNEGSFLLCGRRTGALTPELLRNAGVGYVPADRYGTAVAQTAPVWENLILPGRRTVHKRGMLRREQAHALSIRLIDEAGIKVNTDVDISTLSGGQMQRLILSREIDASTRMLIVSEPFWGLDYQSRAATIERIAELKHRGVGILAFVSDIDDVLEIADVVVVFRRGAIAQTLRGDSVNRTAIGNLMLGLGVSR